MPDETKAANDPTIPDEVGRFLTDALGDGWTADALHGDASVRRYFRVRSGAGSYIVAYYPEAVRESLSRFIRAHSALPPRRVPPVVRHGESVVLQHDVGDQTIFEVLTRDREAAIPLYREAIALLADFQNAPPEARGINPPFDAKKFRDELEMTSEFYVERLCGARPDSALGALFERLAHDLTTHPYVLCHRDYHGENIHLVGNDLYVIDFQDLRMGPDTYDLASLLRDRGAGKVLGDETELRLLREYAERIGADPAIESRYFRNLLQRSIKAIGTFAKQAVTRDRTHYLAYIPPTLEAVDRCLRELPEYAAIREVFPMTYQYDAPMKAREGDSL